MRQPGPWSLAGWLLVLTVFAIGFINFPLQVVGPGFDYLPGDGIDNRLNHYILEHGYRWVTGQEASFWNAPIFFPTRWATTSSDAHLGMLPIYALPRSAGLSPERAFQAWFLIPFVLNYAACVWIIRRLGWGPAAAAAAGFVFTFGLPVVAQLTHCQLFPRFLVPPAVYFAWRWLWHPSTRRLAATAACLVGQAYLSIYVAYFLGLFLAIGFFVGILFHRSTLPWRSLLTTGWPGRLGVALVAAVALLPLLVPYTITHGPKSPEVVQTGFPILAAWSAPADISLHRIWADSFDPIPASTPSPGEKLLFPGLVPLTAVIGFAVLGVRRKSVACLAALSSIALVVLTTRFGDIALYDPLLHLPGVTSIRVVARVVLVLLFPAGVAVAALVEGLARSRPLLAFALLGMIVADQWLVSPNGRRSEDWGTSRFPLATALARQNRVTVAIRQHPAPRLVYLFPGDRPDDLAGRLHLQLDAMRASQDLGLPTVNGWSGYWPPGWKFFAGYQDLFQWLDERDLPRDDLSGLVLIGEPNGDEPVYERAMRATFPPIPLRD